jgi:hypothetical protein
MNRLLIATLALVTAACSASPADPTAVRLCIENCNRAVPAGCGPSGVTDVGQCRMNCQSSYDAASRAACSTELEAAGSCVSGVAAICDAGTGCADRTAALTACLSRT